MSKRYGDINTIINDLVSQLVARFKSTSQYVCRGLNSQLLHSMIPQMEDISLCAQKNYDHHSNFIFDLAAHLMCRLSCLCIERNIHLLQ